VIVCDKPFFVLCRMGHIIHGFNGPLINQMGAVRLFAVARIDKP